MAFEDEYDFQHITSEAIVAEYKATVSVFGALLTEVKELSKKKPDATMSNAKVKIINRVLNNLLTVLAGQPEAKYLETLDNDELPQVSDAVLIMVQFKSALDSFLSRHFQGEIRNKKWITHEHVEKLRQEYEENDEGENEDYME